ncbi:0ef38c7f-d863-45cf-9a66-75e1222e42b0 [Sclerotinia trifoliorum]|uniref:0ef38c7f-d863-45cf-9a66-75e1222e42b0 n=1 Tax=Sclerotinia trifoliorum TaxID=28548 RepID=A0A8H2W100_9HELO|nr:0ef38c7f-d863-45cf-9a66-75e1222e42b0 [Sclerotinia trifoliorum]
MSYPYQIVQQTNNPARTPASSAAVQPSGSANQDAQGATQPDHTATSSTSYQPSGGSHQEVQYVQGPRQVVGPKPAAVAHAGGVTPAQLKEAQDQYNSAPSSQNPAQYSATVPGDVAGKKEKSQRSYPPQSNIMCRNFLTEYECSDWHEKVKNERRKGHGTFHKCEAALQYEAMERQRLGPHTKVAHICKPIEIVGLLQIPIIQRACRECEEKALEAAKRSREADLERIRTKPQLQEVTAALGPAPKEGTGEVAGPKMAETLQLQDFIKGGKDSGSQQERTEAWIKDMSVPEPKTKEQSPDTSRAAGPSGSGKRRRSRK